MSVTQEEVNQLVADRAGELAYEFGSRMPGHRFVNVDGTPQNAQVKVTPGELEALLRVAIEVGMEIEREGTT
jgi:hypothetical protein